MKKRMMVPQRTKNKITIWSKNSTLGINSKELEAGSWRDIFYHIHSSINHNHQEVEATIMYKDRWLGKQNVVSTYNGILVFKKIVLHILQHDEPWGYYVNWNKPVTKRQILYDSTYMRYLK